MPITTFGHVSVTPVRIETTATLAELLEASAQQLYEPPAPASGWGSVHEHDEIVGKVIKGRPRTRQPEIVEEDDLRPEQFRGRLFWDQPDRKAMSILGELGQADSVNALMATDVTISPTAEEGVKLALLGLRQDAQIRGYVVPALRELLLAVDDNARVYTDSSPIDFGDDDFFHWLLYRFHNNPQVSTDILLQDVRSISSQDSLFRGASLSEGASLDRPELLALISAATTKFGPAKLSLTDSHLGLDVDFQLYVDGGFSAYVGKSEYDVDLSRADIGLRLVQDLAYKIIPDLKSAYDGDSNWRKKQRALFQSTSRTALAKVLLPNGCQKCGHDLS